MCRRGGGVEKSITVKDFTFVYDETENTILCIPKSKNGVCFKIDFDIESGTVGVSIGYFKTCSTNQDLPESSGTLIMLQVVMQLIFKHPHIREFKGIVINDNSYLLVQSYEDGNKYRIDLMDMYFLSTGCTWYSSLVPMFLQRKSQEEQYLNDRVKIVGDPRNQLIDASDTHEYPVRWSSFMDHLSPSVRKELQTIVGNVSPYEIASNVLNNIRKERKHSIVFYKHMNIFRYALGGIDGLHGKAWIIPLKQGKIVYSESDPAIVGCMNEKGWMIPAPFLQSIPHEDFAALKQSLQLVDTNNLEEYEIDTSRRVYNPSSEPNDMYNLLNNLNNLEDVDDTLLFRRG